MLGQKQYYTENSRIGQVRYGMTHVKSLCMIERKELKIISSEILSDTILNANRIAGTIFLANKSFMVHNIP